MSANDRRPPRPWLAGVCAWLAWKLGWSVLGVRIAAIVLLLLMPVATGVSYLAGALLLGLSTDRNPERDSVPSSDGGSRELDQRLRDFDRKLEAFDRELARRTTHH